MGNRSKEDSRGSGPVTGAGIRRIGLSAECLYFPFYLYTQEKAVVLSGDEISKKPVGLPDGLNAPGVADTEPPVGRTKALFTGLAAAGGLGLAVAGKKAGFTGVPDTERIWMGFCSGHVADCLF